MRRYKFTSSSNQATTQSSPTTSSPTQKPIPTATIASYTGPAVLGAQLSAFTTKFGQPNDHSSSGQPHLARCGNSNVDKLILSQISLESATGPITSILYASCTPWTVSVAEASCSTFFPADAVYQKSVSVLDSSGNLSAFDKIYYSATLAHEFAADNFTDANQNQVKPGLFDANFLYVSDNTNSHIDRCTIQLGTQQTQ